VAGLAVTFPEGEARGIAEEVRRAAALLTKRLGGPG
jgi:hypothetical protein